MIALKTFNRHKMSLEIRRPETDLVFTIRAMEILEKKEVYSALNTGNYDSYKVKRFIVLLSDIYSESYPEKLEKLMKGDFITKIANVTYIDNPFEIVDLEPTIPKHGKYNYFVLMCRNQLFSDDLKGNM